MKKIPDPGKFSVSPLYKRVSVKLMHMVRHPAPPCGVFQSKKRQEVPARHGVRFRKVRCIILTVSNTYIDAGGYAHE